MAVEILSKKIFAYICNRFCEGAIAQLVEQRTENPCVPGSIPGGTTKLVKILIEPAFIVKKDNSISVWNVSKKVKGLLINWFFRYFYANKNKVKNNTKVP